MERFKHNANNNGRCIKTVFQSYHIQIGGELSDKILLQGFNVKTDVASAINKRARSSDRQSTWLLNCRVYSHALEDTRWSGVQIPPSPPFIYSGDECNNE